MHTSLHTFQRMAEHPRGSVAVRSKCGRAGRLGGAAGRHGSHGSALQCWEKVGDAGADPMETRLESEDEKKLKQNTCTHTGLGTLLLSHERVLKSQFVSTLFARILLQRLRQKSYLRWIHALLRFACTFECSQTPPAVELGQLSGGQSDTWLSGR